MQPQPVGPLLSQTGGRAHRQRHSARPSVPPEVIPEAVPIAEKVAADTDEQIEEAGDADAFVSVLDFGDGTLFEEADAAAEEAPQLVTNTEVEPKVSTKVLEDLEREAEDVRQEEKQKKEGFFAILICTPKTGSRNPSTTLEREVHHNSVQGIDAVNYR